MTSFENSLTYDVIAITGDGAPVVQKFGRLVKPSFQVCHNHTIQLSVKEILYQKKDSSVGENEVSDSTDEDFESSYEDDEAGEPVDVLEVKGNHKNSIIKMRQIIKVFRYSPMKSEILREIQKKDSVPQLKFVTDVVTRWDSLYSSSTRFIKMIPQTIKALKHK